MLFLLVCQPPPAAALQKNQNVQAETGPNPLSTAPTLRSVARQRDRCEACHGFDPDEKTKVPAKLDFPEVSKFSDALIHKIESGLLWLTADVTLRGSEEFQVIKRKRFQLARQSDDPRSAMKACVAKIKTDAASAQQEVLSTLPPDSYKIRYLQPMLMAFSCHVTFEGLKALALHAKVERIDTARTCTLQTRQGRPQIGADWTNDLGYKGEGIGIAILDTGIQYSHVAFGRNKHFPNDKVVGGICIFPQTHTEIDKNDVMDLAGHGTSSGSIAAGKTLTWWQRLHVREGEDYHGGVATEAGIYVVKICQRRGRFQFDCLARAVQWCTDPANHDDRYPLLVICMGLAGGRYYSAENADQTYQNLRLAVDDCNSMGITVFASTGNGGYCDSVGAPSALSNVIGVGAVYDEDQKRYTMRIQNRVPVGLSCAPAQETVHDPKTKEIYTVCVDQPALAKQVCCFSNSHPEMSELVAPSANATAAHKIEDRFNPRYGGTSAACAYAAGAAALLQEAARKRLGRYLSPAEVRNIFKETGDPVLDVKTRNLPRPVTAKLINLRRAIEFVIEHSSSNQSLKGGSS
ncbi:MAG: S8 family serine peptidase [Deltaproteobacteria bacterium]|nr:S8 family serine peptidase [Deltaproteobacteria bacterium]